MADLVDLLYEAHLYPELGFMHFLLKGHSRSGPHFVTIGAHAAPEHIPTKLHVHS